MKRTTGRDYNAVEIDIDGTKYVGTYFIERGMLTVTNLEYGSNSALVSGGLRPHGLATRLLRELVTGG